MSGTNPREDGQPAWKALSVRSWVGVILIIAAGAGIWLANDRDVDRAGVVLGAVVAALAALFAFLQLHAARQQLRTAEADARAQSTRAKEQLKEARELVQQTKAAVEMARRHHDLAVETTTRQSSVAEAQAVFAVDAALAQYEDVRERLTPSGAPDAERLRLRYYMAVFERLGLLLQQGTLTVKTVNEFYGSRFQALLKHNATTTIVKRDPDGWRSFISLWRVISNETERDVPPLE